MAETVMTASQRAKQWDDKFFMEYVRGSRFNRYMGSGENAIIQVNKDLSKKQGDGIYFNLLGALDASAGPNTGATDLVGFEKALPNEGFLITIGVVRDAVVVNNLEAQAAPADIRAAAKVSLMDLSKRYLKLAIITALGSINGVPYATATAGQKDAWNVANEDRVLYGTLVSNFDPVHATALATITAAMTLSTDIVSLAKSIAQTAVTVNGDGIRPYTYGEDEETFVMFAGSNAYRDLKKDMETVHSQARERALTNPLFTGTTSLYWDGVVIREIPEIPATGAVGALGAIVAPCYLCGAQALGIAWAQTTKTTVRKEDDYGFRRGVGFEELRGVAKITYNQDGGGSAIDWSMVTVFVAAAPNA